MADIVELNEQAPITAQSHVYGELRRMLMNGRFLPGERLVVRDLSERFETSAMPVREALRRLVSEDALIDAANRGVVVPPITVDTVTDLVRVRCMVEGNAAEWAAGVMTGAEMAAVAALNDQMLAGIERGLTDEFLSLNRQFHFGIYRAARSATLLQVIERLWLRAGPWLNVMRADDTIRYGYSHHADILAALRAGDGLGARRAVALDVADAGEVIVRHVTSRETAGAGSRKAR